MEEWLIYSKKEWFDNRWRVEALGGYVERFEEIEDSRGGFLLVRGKFVKGKL